MANFVKHDIHVYSDDNKHAIYQQYVFCSFYFLQCDAVGIEIPTNIHRCLICLRLVTVIEKKKFKKDESPKETSAISG